MKLVSMECGSRMHVVGAYAPQRGGARGGGAAGEGEGSGGEDFWDHLEQWVGDHTLVLAGDLNAELQEALERQGRRATAQDRRLHAIARALQPLPTGEPTWTNEQGQSSEIDHVMVHPQQRHLWNGRAETRPGVGTHDHKTVWVEFRGAAEEAEGREQRKVGKNWGRFDDEAKGEYRKQLAAMLGGEEHRDVRDEIRAIEMATGAAAEAVWKDRFGAKEGEGGSRSTHRVVLAAAGAAVAPLGRPRR